MWDKIEFGNMYIENSGAVSTKVVPHFLCTLASVKVTFKLMNHDTELHIDYVAEVDENRVIEKLATMVLENSTINYDLQIQEIIQHYGCELSKIIPWTRKAKDFFAKSYIYRVYEPNLPKIADLLEEWDLLMGQPYTSGELVKGITKDKEERIKLHLTV